MTRALRYFGREAVLSLWRGCRASALAIVTILTGVFVLGVFLLVAFNLDRAAVAWRAAAEVSVYLRQTVTDAERAAVEHLIASSPVVASREFVDPEEARRRFRQLFPDLALAADGVPDNPFPASLELRIRPEAVTSEAVSALIRELERQPGVADVQYDRRWLDRLAGIAAAVRWIGLGLALVLAAAAGLTVANVVRLALHARRDEIEILHLMGAPLAYIRGPFVVEGLLQGGLGAVGAIVVLLGGFAVVQGRFGRAILQATGGVELGFLPVVVCLGLVVGGMAVGCLGGYVAARTVR